MSFDALTKLIGDALASLPEGPLTVALSGGLDSTALLHLLTTQPEARQRSLSAIHVNHGLHPQSADWKEHCRVLCEQLDVPLIASIVAVTDTRGQGLEAAARAARYWAFSSVMQAGEILALAHHADDQAETLLLRLLRGAGTSAAASMRERVAFANGMLWRPLLSVPRAELLRYAERHGLHWIDDPSNTDTRHDRNFLRHEIFPLLGKRWPHAALSLARSARLLAEDAERLARIDAQRLREIQGSDPATLPLPALRELPPEDRRALLRAWLTSLALPLPPAGVLDSFDAAFLKPRPDAETRLAWRGADLRHYRDRLYALPPQPSAPVDWTLKWTGLGRVELPTGFGALVCESVQGESNDAPPPAHREHDWHIRPRRGGERIRLPRRTHSLSVKSLLQQHGIPPWQRERLPLLFDSDGELLAVSDLLLSDRLLTLLSNENRSLHWFPG